MCYGVITFDLEQSFPGIVEVFAFIFWSLGILNFGLHSGPKTRMAVMIKCIRVNATYVQH